MYNNYYFIKRLAAELDETLQGAELVESFSQNKDELILGFALPNTEDFFIKADLGSRFSCLSFPQDFARSKRNSVNLFQELVGLKVLAVRYFLNERAFYIDFGKFRLVIKLFGRFSNLVLFEENEAVFLFNQNFDEDQRKSFESYHKDIDQSEEAYLASGFEETFPVLRGEVEVYLNQKGFFDLSAKAQYAQLLELQVQFEQTPIKVGAQKDKWQLTLLNESLEEEHSFTSALEALTFFYNRFIATQYLSEARQRLVTQRKANLKKWQKNLQQQQLRVDKLDTDVPDKELADIIMANLYHISPQLSSVELFDFYRNQPIVIALKKDLSPQKNAERYYRRSKNAHVEQEKLTQSIAGLQLKIDEVEKELETIEAATDFRELKRFIKEQSKTVVVQSPFKEYTKDGFQILVGRNAKNNDLLTLKNAHKNDLWLHAKDVSGSHVIVKVQSGKKTPQHVIEYAASIAAFYSKRKTDTLCPVTVTTKKFVRKVKGSPAGAVIVDKEEVILVPPISF